MKRNFTKKPIFAMSVPRKTILDKMEGYAPEIEEHLVKCVVYKSSHADYNHWIEEIAAHIDAINVLTAKPNSKKLKEVDYVNVLFGNLGDERNDAKSCLHYFKTMRTNPRKTDKPYPAFEVIDELIETAFQMFQEVCDKMSAILATANRFQKSDIEIMIHSIVDKYCK